MAPHPDDHFLPFREIASPEEADLEYRKLTVGHALSELGIARGVQLDDAHLLVYTRALIDLDTELVVEACRYFGLQKRKDGDGRKDLAPKRQEIKSVETSLDKLGQERARLEKELAGLDYSRDPAHARKVTERHAALIREIEQLETRWLELSERLESLNG